MPRRSMGSGLLWPVPHTLPMGQRGKGVGCAGGRPLARCRPRTQSPPIHIKIHLGVAAKEPPHVAAEEPPHFWGEVFKL